MSDQVLDQVRFAVGADIGPLQAQYAKIDSETDALAARIKAKSATFFSETQGGSSRIMQMRQAIADLSSTAAAASPVAQKLEKDLENVGNAASKSHGAASTATREFRALFDEFSSGRTRMVPGTLAIIAQRVFGISGATLAWGAALAAIPIAWVAAAAMAESSISRVNRAMAASGFSSGLGGPQAFAMAGQLNATSQLSMRGGMSAISALGARGNLGPAEIGMAARDVPGFASATGQSDDKAAAALEKLLAEPAKGAEELNSEFKLLSVSQQRQIETLAKSGQTEEAQMLLLKALGDRFGDLKDKTNILGNAFDRVAKGFSNWWFQFGEKLNVGLGGGTPQDRIAELRHEEQYQNPQERQHSEAMIAGLQKGIDDAANKAAAGRFNATSQSNIGEGLKDADSESNKFGSHLQDMREELARDNIALISAIQTHSSYRDVIQKQVTALGLAIKNQLDPAQEAALKASEDRRIAGASPRDKSTIEAQVKADRARREALANPATALYADQIGASDDSVAGVAQGAKSSQKIADTLAEAEAQNKLAEAYGVSTAAVVRQKASSEAHAAFLKGEITNERAYAEVLLEVASATARADNAASMSKLNENNAALLNIAGGDGSPAAVAAAKRHNEAVAQYRQQFAAARTPAEIAAAQSGQNNYEQGLGTRDATNLSISSADKDRQLQQSINMKKLENATMTDAEPLRTKEIADLETRNELVNEGFAVDSDAFNQELSNRSKLNDELREYNDQLQATQKSQQQWVDLSKQGVDELGKVFQTMEDGHASLKRILQDLERDLANLIVKLAVLNPLENAAQNYFAPGSAKSGQQPTMSFGGVATAIGNFIGGGASTDGGGGGAAISGGTFGFGGAWDRGKRYAALGDVLDGPARFNTASGPIIGGEAGAEALMPLARGPSGKLGVAAQVKGAGAIHIYQQNTIHPDVSRIARVEAMRVVKEAGSRMVGAVKQAHLRGAAI